ncbi:unnamed protein product, partial [Protopolystoma xenopodis]
LWNGRFLKISKLSCFTSSLPSLTYHCLSGNCFHGIIFWLFYEATDPATAVYIKAITREAGPLPMGYAYTSLGSCMYWCVSAANAATANRLVCPKREDLVHFSGIPPYGLPTMKAGLNGLQNITHIVHVLWPVPSRLPSCVPHSPCLRNTGSCWQAVPQTKKQQKILHFPLPPS